jgi:hypothetical protein
MFEMCAAKQQNRDLQLKKTFDDHIASTRYNKVFTCVDYLRLIHFRGYAAKLAQNGLVCKPELLIFFTYFTPL